MTERGSCPETPPLRMTVDSLIGLLQELSNAGHGDVEIWDSNYSASGALHARYEPRLVGVCLPKRGSGYPKWADQVKYMGRPENWEEPFTVVRL